MPRRRKHRWIGFRPEVHQFRPVTKSNRPALDLRADEIEAIRLADFLGLDQISAAKQMGISQSTFQRLIKEARHKIATALITVRKINLKGGDEDMPRLNRGRGQGRGFGPGVGGYCVCTNPKCNYRQPHQPGQPCFQLKCPKCGSPMIREEAAQVLENK